MPFLTIVWDPSIGIDLGFFTIRYYSLMYLIAFTLGWYIIKYIFKQEKINLEKLDSLFIYMILGTLIGARLGHVIFYQPELFKEDFLSVFLPMKFVPEIEFTGFQGLASHGAAIGILIAMYIYSKKKLQGIKQPMLWIMDRVVIPVASGGVFIRLGNFINSEIVGKPSELPWAVKFVQQSPGYGAVVPRHPAQLYEAIGYILVFVLLWYIYNKTDKKQYRGYIFGLFLILLFMVRFVVEFFKEAQVEERADWFLNTGQLLSIPFIIVGIYFMWRASKTSNVIKAS